MNIKIMNIKTILLFSTILFLISCSSQDAIEQEVLDFSTFKDVLESDRFSFWVGKMAYIKKYPSSLVQSNGKACVLVFYSIDSNGRVHNARVVGSYPEIYSDVANAAISGVSRSRFTPSATNIENTPINTYTTLNFVVTEEDNPSSEMLDRINKNLRGECAKVLTNFVNRTQ